MVDIENIMGAVGNHLQVPGRPECDLGTCNYWNDLLRQPLMLTESSRAGTAICSSCKADVTSIRSFSRCHSSNAEDPLLNGGGIAQLAPLQPAHGTQEQQADLEPSAALLECLDQYLACNGASEQLREPFLHEGFDAPATGFSSGSSKSDESLLHLMLPVEGFPSQHCDNSSPSAQTALQNASAVSVHVASTAACAEATADPADSVLEDLVMRAASSDSSVDWFSSAQAQPCPAVSSMLQQTSQPAPFPSRKRGRPRRYDTTLPLGTMDAHMAAGYPTVNGEEAGVRKRGAKPKYKFVTAEEAVAHRRERNRATAVATHEKKKAREVALKAELDLRQGEHDALVRLLEYIQHPAADKGMVRRLLLGEDGAQGSICDAMEFLLTTKVA